MGVNVCEAAVQRPSDIEAFRLKLVAVVVTEERMRPRCIQMQAEESLKEHARRERRDSSSGTLKRPGGKRECRPGAGNGKNV